MEIHNKKKKIKMFSKILMKVFKIDRDNDERYNPQGRHPSSNYASNEHEYENYINHDIREIRHPSEARYHGRNYVRSQQTYKNKHPKIENPNNSHALSNNMIIPEYGKNRRPLGVAHANINHISRYYNRRHDMNFNRRLPMNRGQNNGKYISEEQPILKGNPYRCRIHSQSQHNQWDCRMTCGFCRKRGIHLSKNCNIKSIVKQDFINKKVAKFGVKAEYLARDLISQQGIKRINDSQFLQMLRLHPQGIHVQAVSRIICNLCRHNIEHPELKKKDRSQIMKIVNDSSKK